MKCDFVSILALLVVAPGITSLAVEHNEFPPNPPIDMCGRITEASSDKPWFFASDVYACLTSVPFNPAVASRFIKYYNETIQFHSTLDLLKAPPASYTRAAVDLVQGLARIQVKVDSGAYHNQYAFEHELQSLIISAHDGHLRLYAGVLNQFTFGGLYEIIALSEDGRKVPEVYILNKHLKACVAKSDCEPIPIKTMNGIPVVDFLSDFAANQSFGLLESHADWNQLMMTPALTIQGGMSTFGGAATLYPGDKLDIVLKNGSDKYSYYFLSLYDSPGYTGPLTTGGDFYNFFVLGITPKSYDPARHYKDSSVTEIHYSVSEAKKSWYSSSHAYPPRTLVSQDGLGVIHGSDVTGYLLKDISTAILSIPSFLGDDDDFSDVISEFVKKAAGTKKVIIDLQQNTGGQAALALKAFNWFFPGIVPFAGSRMRAHETANVIGHNINDFFEGQEFDHELYTFLLSLEWVVTDRIDARTGRNFTSWADYFGPRLLNDSRFTRDQRYNLSSELFNYWNLATERPLNEAFDDSAPKRQAPWRAQDIVILTDGLCSSACALFVEVMTQQTGVRTVVVGGRPESGPMQAVSGTRGAAAYSSAYLDADINIAVELNSTAQAVLPVRGDTPDSGMRITYAGFNLRDQVENNATLPNQMRYLPADCRIYWSFANFNNYTRLWHDVSTAMFEDPSLCVQGSINATASSIKRRDVTYSDTGGTDVQHVDISSYIVTGLDGLPAGVGVDDEVNFTEEPVGFPGQCSKPDRTGKKVGDRTKCSPGTTCVSFPVPCKTCRKNQDGIQCATTKYIDYRCLVRCKSASLDACGDDNIVCHLTGQENTRNNILDNRKESKEVKEYGDGWCVPKPQYSFETCSEIVSRWNVRASRTNAFWSSRPRDQ